MIGGMVLVAVCLFVVCLLCLTDPAGLGRRDGE